MLRIYRASCFFLFIFTFIRTARALRKACGQVCSEFCHRGSAWWVRMACVALGDLRDCARGFSTGKPRTPHHYARGSIDVSFWF